MTHSGPRCRRGPDGRVQLLLEGVLNFRSGHLGVALNLVTAPFGFQARAVGGAACGFLSAAFYGFGLVRQLLENTHGGTFRGVILLARTRQPGHRDRRPGGSGIG